MKFVLNVLKLFTKRALCILLILVEYLAVQDIIIAVKAVQEKTVIGMGRFNIHIFQ